MAASCSHWWHAPIYFTISVILAFIAISTAFHPKPNNAIPPPNSIAHHFSLNASRALRKSGFNIISAIIQISPDLFLSPSNSTIFAIKDSAFSNVSLSPALLRDLLHYHTSPSKISMQDLLQKPQGSCLPTMFDSKNVAVTKLDAKKRLVEINHVLVTHPDIFLDGSVAIHGVLGPFSSLTPRDIHQGSDFIRSPICDSKLSVVSEVGQSKNIVEWNRIVQLLSSYGFVSFAIGLHSVLDGILEDYKNLNSVTIFAPPDFAFVASSPPLLDQIVRFHTLPQRFSSMELASLPDKALLKTLVPGQDLVITGGSNFTQGFALNGVEIDTPDIISAKQFIIHGISRAFEMAELPNTSK